MPNSAIFEFDTWQNGNLNDPFDEHCAFNINGNMNHNSSIDGPVILGNIEDGLDHTILFEWDPAGNLYSLYFDDVLMFSGSYDIINNCFGGSTTAYWGYTSATGGATNLHVVCPIVEVYNPSYTEYNEVDICEGEAYMGHTESGFYVDFIPGANGCDYQLNTLLTVHEISEPEYIYDVVCEGEYILVANEVFTLPDVYEINTYTQYGCDSTIILELENVIPSVEIIEPPTISCLNPTVQLTPVANSNFPINSVFYSWSGEIYTNQEVITTSTPGTYFLTAQINSNGLSCIASTNITIEIDTISPTIEDQLDLTLDCNSIKSDTLLWISNLEDHLPSWTYQDSLIGQTDTIPIIGPGQYAVMLMDTLNGCFARDSFTVTFSNDIPIIDLSSDKLNCLTENLLPDFSTTGSIDSIVWTFNNQLFSNDSIPEISEPGEYTVQVITADGCESSASLEVIADTTAPVISLLDTVLQCDILSMNLEAFNDQNATLEWSSMHPYIDSSSYITINEEGWYFVKASDPSNYCVSTDSAYVEFKGSSPQISVQNDTINCYEPTLLLNPEIDQDQLDYTWIYQNTIVGTDKDLEVTDQGWYSIEVINDNGCTDLDSTYITSNFQYPKIEVSFDSINCINPLVTVESIIENGETILWNGPNQFQFDGSIFTTSISGTYIASAANNLSGCSTFDTIEIIDTSIDPVFTLSTDTLDCVSTEIQLPFYLETSYLELNWSGPSGFTSTIMDPTISDPGTYILHVEFEGECTLDTTVFIAQDISTPSYSIEFDSITCNSPQVEINTVIDDPISSFIMNIPNGNSSTSTNYIGTDSGLYTFEFVGNNGCSVSDTIQVNAYLDLPEVVISEYDSITCDSPFIEIQANSNTNDANFDWIGPNNYSDNSSNIVVSDPGILHSYGNK